MIINLSSILGRVTAPSKVLDIPSKSGETVDSLYVCGQGRAYPEIKFSALPAMRHRDSLAENNLFMLSDGQPVDWFATVQAVKGMSQLAFPLVHEDQINSSRAGSAILYQYLRI